MNALVSLKSLFVLLFGGMIGTSIDPNIIAVESLSNYYKEKCRLLNRKMKQSGCWVNLESDK